MSLFQDVIGIYKSRGLEHLSYRALDYIHWKSKEHISEIFNIYWGLKRERQTFDINGVSAEFGSSKDEGGDVIRSQIHTEYELISDLLKNIEDGDVFYDVGANVGLVSHFAGQICSSVIAFEPYPPNYTQLIETLSDNPAKVQTYNLALADSKSEVAFSATEGLGQSTGSIGAGDITVNAERGDEVISQEGLEKPDIVKIDVEGAEGLVIAGLENALQDTRRVYCEIHLPADHRTSIETYDWTPMDILSKLESLGFDIHFLNNRGPEIQVVGERSQ